MRTYEKGDDQENVGRDVAEATAEEGIEIPGGLAEVLGMADVADLVDLGRDDPEVHRRSLT
jgi:hypothetical protein